MNKIQVKKNDTVIVLSGKDKGKQGKIVRTVPENGKVVVEGINVVKRHQKPTNRNQQGGIIKMEAPLAACKVMRVCPKCGKPTREAYLLLADGTKERVCKKCGESI